MKKSIVCAFLLAVAIHGVKAQDLPGEDRERFGPRYHRESLEKLNLSEDQRSKFRSLNDDFRKQMQDLRKNEDITVREWKGRMEALRKDHRTKMQDLLTSDQKTQLEKMKEDRIAKRREEQDARMQRMKDRLGLNDEQVSRLKQDRTEMSAKIKALREDKSLSDEQRRDQVKDLLQKHKESLKTILTDEQLKKLHEKQTRRSAKQPV